MNYADEEKVVKILENHQNLLDEIIIKLADLSYRIECLERDSSNHEDEIRSLVVDVGNATDEITGLHSDFEDLSADIENLMLQDGNP
jgi:hypothetical protein